MIARVLFFAATGVFIILASGNVAYRAGFASGEASGINTVLDRSELAILQREARNERLINFMVAEGQCPPVDAYCPAVRMR